MRLRTMVALGLAKICGAHARSTGQPCKAKLLLRGGRCRLHGGCSTGATSEAGRKRALEALRVGWLRWQARRKGKG